MLTTRVDLDISKPLYNKITAKQGDIASRFLEFHLHANGVPFSLENKNVRFHMLKPDGTEIFNDVPKGSDVGVCILELTSQCLIEPGIGKAELVIYMNSKKLSTIPFKIEIIESVNSEAAELSSNEFSALDEALSKIDKINLLDEVLDRAVALEPKVASWVDFKNNGGTISGDVDFSTGLNARRVSLKNDQNDFFSFITLNDTTIGIKFNDSILQTLDRFGEFYIGGYSKEPNGYTKLPNGFIIQWGHAHLSNDLGTGLICTSLSFPIQFPRDICHVYLTPCVNQYSIDVEYDSSWERPPVVYQITPSDFGFAFNRTQGQFGSDIKWFAIGY